MQDRPLLLDVHRFGRRNWRKGVELTICAAQLPRAVKVAIVPRVARPLGAGGTGAKGTRNQETFGKKIRMKCE
jgi:hypothetical protein